MQIRNVWTLASGLVLAAPLAHAAGSGQQELAAIRAEIRAMKHDYDQRLQTLEQRLQAAQQDASSARAELAAQNVAAKEVLAQNVAPAAAAAAAEPAPAAPLASTPPANLFNPNISMILGGTLQNLSQDPSHYRLQGFQPGGEGGPGKRGFNLGESELTMAANIDPQFAGQLTFALAPDDTISVEEAFVRTRDLAGGVNLKFGRFLSGLGYLNGQHAHTWDFVDAPLAYQAFLGGQYKQDGVQLRWLAPTEQFLELGLEAGAGANFPGNDRNKNGAGAVAAFVHTGDDLGDAASYRAGLSYLHTAATARSFDDGGLSNAFSGSSALWMADAIYKWAPNGNPTSTNFKLQGEYFRRKESGSLDVASGSDGAASGSYRSVQSGWYLQSVYQFMPNWRLGARYDRLASGTPQLGLADGLAQLPLLQPYHPERSSVMVDYSPSEFSRLRLQLARDRARPGAYDNQIFLQYIMSLGTHAAHAF